jgi:putative sterol carrier protein
MSQIDDMFAKIQSSFNPQAAQGVSAVFQWEITGEGGGIWQIVVADGKCEVKEGSLASPNVTMKMDSNTYLALTNKQLNPMQAFMSGKLKVSGDIMLAQKLQQLFGL